MSPYLCMAAGVFNLIAGNWLRVAYVYSLVVLTLMTLAELVSLHLPFELMALENIVAGGVWVWWYCRNTADKPETPPATNL